MSELSTISGHVNVNVNVNEAAGGGGAPVVNAIDHRGDVPDFKMDTQLLDNWCWAAVTQAIEGHRDKRIDQSDVATDHVGRTCTTGHEDPGSHNCGNPCPGTCDGQHSLGRILKERELLSGEACAGAPSFEQIQGEIARNRVVPVRINWDGGGGHFVCATGWRIGSGGRQFVRVHDPLWPGRDQDEVDEQEMSFDVFVSDYVLTGDKGSINFYYPLR